MTLLRPLERTGGNAYRAVTSHAHVGKFPSFGGKVVGFLFVALVNEFVLPSGSRLLRGDSKQNSNGEQEGD